MGLLTLAGAIWLGLVLLGAWVWVRSRRAGQKIGQSIGTLFLGLWLPATFAAYGLYAILAARTWLFDRLFRLVEIGGKPRSGVDQHRGGAATAL